MKISKRPFWLGLVGMVGVLAAGWAQVPLGPQFRVDPSNLVPYVRYPAGLAFTPDGTLWIAWESHGGSPFFGIGARSVTPSGVLSRPLLPLPGTAQIPLLVPVPGGLAVFGQDQLPAIELRRLSAAGKLRGHPVLVQKAEGLFNSYVVTPLPGGGFFVVFAGDDCPGQRCGSLGVFGRVLDSLGQPLTPVFPINETRGGDQLPTGVVADPEGNVSVVWFGPVPDPLQYAVFTRRFSRAGKPLGGERRISIQTQGTEGGAAADAQGNFVVTWAANTSETTTAIFARRFSSQGDPLGDEFPVSQEVADAEVAPAVAMSPTGDFFIAWESSGCAGCDYIDVKGRLFYAGGTSENEFLVDDYRQGSQFNPSVAFGPGGRLAVAWLGDSDAHYETEVDARLFMVPPR